MSVHPPLDWPDYRSTALRHPKRPLSALTVPGQIRIAEAVGPDEHDLTSGHGGEPLGERIVVHGRVLDTDGRPVPDVLLEVWQANAAGRYRHAGDGHPAPLDPNFTGEGRCVTGSDGGFRFVTVKPGAYPWGNHHNAWRPAHIHVSLLGRVFTQRLVTQMYFPDDPLFAFDPIFNSVRDAAARESLIARFDLETSVPGWALAYRFDIVLRSTPMEDG
jgi:protocatechuate 3,4-dioxygenase beta subunit